MFSGACMCGQVTFEADHDPNRILNCHCQSCRRHTGAPIATLVVFDPNHVRFAGTPRKKFASAPGVKRAFCPNCGTSLTWETTLGDEPICAIHVSAFSEPDSLVPDGHTFYGERLPWLEVLDQLPRFDGFATGATPVQMGPTPNQAGRTGSDGC